MADAVGVSAVQRILGSPMFGFLPWIVFSVIVGSGRYGTAVLAAIAIAIAIVLLGLLGGVRAKLLDIVAIGFFAVMLLLGSFAGPAARSFLERWGGEISDLVILLVAFGSLLLRKPFTMQYARELVEPEELGTPLFLHINMVVTAAWSAAFAVGSLLGWYGDGPLHQPDNDWTNWVLPVGIVVLVIRFGEWYPDRAVSKARRAAGLPDEIDPAATSPSALLVPLAGYLVSLGLLLALLDDISWTIAVALVVIGAASLQSLRWRRLGRA